MKNIDGRKVELTIREIYKIFEEKEITGNEAAAIAGMILVTSGSFVKKKIKETWQEKMSKRLGF